MRKFVYVIVACGALAQPAIAQSTWEKLDRGVDVVRECEHDIHQYCKGTSPGEGRIKACMASHLPQLSDACVKALAEPKPAVLSDGVNAKTKRIENSHLMRFIEMYLAGIDPDTGDIVAECYGTYANPNIPANGDSSPQAQVAALNMEQIKKQYGVLAASLNGPKLWIPDWFDVEVGVVREFGEIKAPWTAQLNMGRNIDVTKVEPYEPMTIARKSAINWNKGRTVMVLDDPAGNTWIMKGFQLGLKPRLTYEQFMAAGPSVFKKLPPGWKVRVVTLKQDNHEVPENGVATIVTDEFFNVYDRTGPGMSNSKP
ncbi:MAG: hypothetical protein U1F09_10315 [Steroidobacteraceae bacterium]